MLSADLEGTAAEGLGIRRSVVENLAMKTLFYLGDASVQELAEQLRVAPYIVEGIFQRLRKDQLMQAIGLAAGGHRVNLTSQGRARALELLSTDQYVGPAPVSFASYVERVKSQSVRDIVITEADAVEAFRELVLEPGWCRSSARPSHRAARSSLRAARHRQDDRRGEAVRHIP